MLSLCFSDASPQFLFLVTNGVASIVHQPAPSFPISSPSFAARYFSNPKRFSSFVQLSHLLFV
jgi:hypothetical protein